MGEAVDGGRLRQLKSASPGGQIARLFAHTMSPVDRIGGVSCRPARHDRGTEIERRVTLNLGQIASPAGSVTGSVGAPEPVDAVQLAACSE